MPSASRQKIGLAFLGANYMQAYEMYKDMAEKYFKQSKENKSAFVAAIRCYTIAATNAMQISTVFNDDRNETKKLMLKNAQDNLKFAEMCKQKMVECPEFDPRKVYKSQFNERENLIIDHSNRVRGKTYEMFTPASGIVK